MSFLIILEVVQGQRNKLYPILSNYILVSGQDPPGPAKSHRALQHADPPQRAGQDRGGDRGEVPNMEPPRKFPRMEPLVGSSGATEVSEEWEGVDPRGGGRTGREQQSIFRKAIEEREKEGI